MQMKTNMIIIFLSLILCKSYAQLTSPGEVVCVGKQVVFVCQRDYFTRWSVFLPGGTTYELRVFPSQAPGTILTFQNDTSFGFKIHVLSSSSDNTVHSELRVTAVRQINGTTVECEGRNGFRMSTIQIASADPPAAPSGVMTTADQSQFTLSTASITLTWSASSGANNYTIMVTPLLSSGQSLVSTSTTSLQLTVLYNKEYSINITAQNCVGSNSIIVSLTVDGCSSPSPLANGRISEHSSGAVGAMLTFQCDTGYLPQEEVTSTCLSNRSWVPSPECETVLHCGAPLAANGVVIDHFNDSMLGALITFHCEESDYPVMSICGSDRRWDPNPSSFDCPTTAPDSGNNNTLSTRSQVIISTIICSVIFLLLGMFLGALFYHCAAAWYKQKFNTTSTPSTPPAPVVYKEVSHDSHTKKRNDNIIKLSENVAYGPVTK